MKFFSYLPVIPQCMVQSGDITAEDGTGGESIYGQTFKDENFTVSVITLQLILPTYKKNEMYH